MTAIVSLVACILEGRAFFISKRTKGSVSGPEFCTAIQTFLLQGLALYTTIAPALRSDGPRYQVWTWLLSVLILGSAAASLIVYSSSTALSALLVCIASFLQAFVTLQLVFALDDEDKTGQKTSKKTSEKTAKKTSKKTRQD